MSGRALKPDSSLDREGRAWLVFFAFFTCYRYRTFLRPQLRVPNLFASVDFSRYQEKARTSLATAGVVFGFTVAVLVGVLTLKDVWTSVIPQRLSAPTAGHLLAGALLPYGSIWCDRFISSASMDRGKPSRKVRRLLFWLVFLLNIFFFIGYPLKFPAASTALSGLALAFAAALFLLVSLELYDTAASWQAANHREFVFHLANLGSQSYIVGLFTAFVAISELFFLVRPWFGRVATVLSLLASFGLSEVERGLRSLMPELPSN